MDLDIAHRLVDLYWHWIYEDGSGCGSNMILFGFDPFAYLSSLFLSMAELFWALFGAWQVLAQGLGHYWSLEGWTGSLVRFGSGLWVENSNFNESGWANGFVSPISPIHMDFCPVNYGWVGFRPWFQVKSQVFTQISPNPFSSCVGNINPSPTQS